MNILRHLQQQKHRVIDYEAHSAEEAIPEEQEQDYESGIFETVKNIQEKCGRIDAFVTCPEGPGKVNFMDQSIDSWESILNGCLSRNLFICKAFLPGMMRQRFGRIVTVFSLKAMMGESGEAVFYSALGGLNLMTKCVAKEVGRYNITANNVCYGLLEGEYDAAVETATDHILSAQLPTRKYCSYGDIANAVHLLLSPEAAYINGKDIVLDGGVM